MRILPFGTALEIPPDRVKEIFDRFPYGSKEFDIYIEGRMRTLWHVRPEKVELLRHFGPYVIFNLVGYREGVSTIYFRFWDKHDALKFKLMVW